jgi:hypothetical protein
LRQKFRPEAFAVIQRPAAVHIIAILVQPIPVERAFTAVTRLAHSIDLDCTGIAPNIGRRGAWVAPKDLSGEELYEIGVAQAGEIDLRLAAGKAGMGVVIDPVCGMVATSVGPNIFAASKGV